MPRWPNCWVADAAAARYPDPDLPIDPLTFRDQAVAAGVQVLAITEAHAIATTELPGLHQDPFDRLLIAQARLEGLMAVSADLHWRRYELLLHQA